MTGSRTIGTVRIAGEPFEIWVDPGLDGAGECDLKNRRITLRELSLKHAVHEMFHALVWAHGLDDLIRPGGEEALACAMEISWFDAYARLRAVLEPE